MKRVRFWKILHVHSDIVRNGRICLIPPPPFLRKNQKWAPLPSPLVKKSEIGRLPPRSVADTIGQQPLVVRHITLCLTFSKHSLKD